MKLILGLGNPGSRYARTRHNFGADVVMEVARQLQLSLSHTSYQAEWGKAMLAGEVIVFALPQTYMNCSGEAAYALTNYFKIPPQQVLVICDDLNLPLGALRLRAQGSDGGHNGLKSISEALNSKSYHRLRLGVGRPSDALPVTDFVLSRFTAEEQPQVKATLTAAANAVRCWAEQGIAKASQEFN